MIRHARLTLAPGLPIALALLLALAACGPTSSAPGSISDRGAIPAGCPTAQPAPLGADETRTVTLATEKGDIVISVKGALSPIATGNFVALAECGYYDGVIFQRLVPGFVIQGGDGLYGRTPNVNVNRVGSGGPGYKIADEVVTVPYERGTVAMARSRQPNSQGSQFFIVLDDAAATMGLAQANTYAIMGEVTAGMDVVDEIAAMPNMGPSAGNLAMSPVSFNVTVTTP